MADKGWIKIYRQIQDSAIWTSDRPFDDRSAWIDLIMMANIESKSVLYRGQTVIVNRGDVYTSVRKLAARWHWSTGKVSRYLNNLTKLEMVKRKKSTKSATLLTLVNYEDFQSVRYRDKDTDKDTNKDTDEYTDGRLLKNIKKKKENKEGAPPISGESAAPKEEKERIEVIPGYTQEELDENFLDGFIPMTEEEWNALPDV